MTINLAAVNNTGGGCMGMCAEPFNYVLKVQKMVAGTQNFATSFVA